MPDRLRSLAHRIYRRCPHAGAGHGKVLFGRQVHFTVTPEWWGLPLMVCRRPMPQIGVLCFRLYWWRHDDARCLALTDTVFT